MEQLGFLENAAKSLTNDLDQWMAGHMKSPDPKMAEDMVSIVNAHALAAAAAGLGVTMLPGAGSTISMVTAAGVLWHMYLRINERIGLKLSKVMLKSLATAVLSNIAQSAISVAGAVAASALLSLTGLGAIPSMIMMASLDYAVTLVGGVIYLKVLTGLFHAGMDPENMSEADIRINAENTISKEYVGDMLRQARNHYKEARKSGEVTGKETVVMED